MTVKPTLHIVAPSQPTREARIRALLAELDQAEAVVNKAKAALAEEGAAYARDRGEFMRASIERMRRDLGL